VQEDVIKEAEKDKASSPVKEQEATVVLSTNGEAGKWLGDCMGRYDQVEGDVLKYRQQDTVSNITYQLSRQAPVDGLTLPRVGDTWQVVEEGKTIVCLRAPASQDIASLLDGKPPCSGWSFWNRRRKEHEADPELSCSLAIYPPCSVIVTLTGKARTKIGECGGEYQPVEAWSRGRQVGTGSGSSLHWPQVLRRSGPGEVRWFRVRAGDTEWSISDSPGGKKWYMLSGSAGSCCPADPAARASTTSNSGEWRWRDGLGFSEGGVSVVCSAHKY
jgi:hypothetical protein